MERWSDAKYKTSGKFSGKKTFNYTVETLEPDGRISGDKICIGNEKPDLLKKSEKYKDSSRFCDLQSSSSNSSDSELVKRPA